MIKIKKKLLYSLNKSNLIQKYQFYKEYKWFINMSYRFFDNDLAVLMINEFFILFLR